MTEEENKKELIVMADKTGYVDCPFCYKKHKHGKGGGNGNRVPDCNSLFINNPVFRNGNWHPKSEGYYVVFKDDKP